MERDVPRRRKRQPLGRASPIWVCPGHLVTVETRVVHLRRRLLRPAACGRTALIVGSLALLAVSGCGSSGPSARIHGTIARITERDFRISAPKRMASGDVVLSVRNRGPDAHELIVVRTKGARLPLRTDGTTVSEERLEPRVVGILEPGKPGSVRGLQLHLAPGRYTLFCNMSGHYLGGMHTELVVR